METSQFLADAFKLLKNSGFHNLRADSEFIYMEDPACILRAFETFIEYAWIAIVFFTGLLIFGWAISMIRGAKYDNILVNMRNLILIFGGLALVKPVINLVYGEDLFARACRTIAVPYEQVQELLERRYSVLAKHDPNKLYENLVIQDSGAIIENEQPVPQLTTEIASVDVAQTITTTPNAESKPVTATVNVASLAISATESGKDVIYIMPDGSRVKRSGGTRAWRNSNPGNIRYSKFSQRVGAIGQAGDFAVFPDEATGMYAIEALLRTDSYNKLTVAGAISRYAPPSENDTAAYHRNIERLTGLSINKRMADLSAAELTQVAKAIRQIEGWREGTTQRI